VAWVKALRVHLCRVAGNTDHMAGDVSYLWDGFPNKNYATLTFNFVHSGPKLANVKLKIRFTLEVKQCKLQQMIEMPSTDFVQADDAIDHQGFIVA